MGYKIVMQYSDGTTEEADDVFDTEEEANDYGTYLVSCHDLGGEILHMSNPGDYPLSDDEPNFEVIEVAE